jgi:hypothetical protein
MNRLLFAILPIFLITSCALPPKQSSEEQANRFKENKQASTRLYPQKSPEQVTKAVQETLVLLDPDDMKVVLTEGGVLANRFSTFYAVYWVGYGRDYYSVKLNQTPTGTEAKLTYEGVMNSGLFITAPPDTFKADIPITSDQNPSDSKLFHDRVEYMLGLRQSWVSCADFENISEPKNRPIFFCDRLGLVNNNP